jgi:hypothetical protein
VDQLSFGTSIAAGTPIADISARFWQNRVDEVFCMGFPLLNPFTDVANATTRAP